MILSGKQLTILIMVNMIVAQSNEVKEAMIELRKFMFKNIYLGTHLKEERIKAKFVLETLVNYYFKTLRMNCLTYIKK